jgi:phosphate transport system permease protein
MANRSDAIEPQNITDRLTSTYEKMDLRRKPRWGERIITALLFISGAISILTTIGIVIVLGRESIHFFTSQMWEATNKPIVYDISPDETLIRVGDTGKTIQEGDIIRISKEVMLVKTVQQSTLLVERGIQDTLPAEHAAGSKLFRGVSVSLFEFFSGTEWQPQLGKFGIWPLLNATLIVSTIAMLVALPIGLSIAIYLSEYASDRARSILKPTLEVLAGIPTVVYGYFALTMITPLLRSVLGKDFVEIYNMASGGIVVGILIIPLVSSLSEDALSAVPRSLREAAYALGATKLETALKVVLPAAISGITAAFIIAISRAVGETMIVALAVGAGPNFTFNPFKSAETITGHIVRISGGDLSYDSIDYNSIFALALVLFFMTLGLNIVSQRIVRRFREVYE